MRFLFLLLAFCTTIANAQTDLNFNKRYVESEDHWVILQQHKDGSYPYGFIYIDPDAGLTLNYEGSFTISPQGTYIPKKMDSVSLKYRLEPDNARVAFVPESRYKELQITTTPEWLKFYKEDTGTVQHLFRWGYLYNSWGEYSKAFTFLEKAQKIDPEYKGLKLELAFTYNALEQYGKAEAVMESAIQTNPDECLFYRELSFAQMHINELEKAAKTYGISLTKCTDDGVKSEIAYNLTYQYYKRKDADGFRKWVAETKKWAKSGDDVMVELTKLEKAFSNQ